VAVLSDEPRAELHQRVDEDALQPVAVLEMPVADRLAVQVAAEPCERLFQLRRRALLLSLEGAYRISWDAQQKEYRIALTQLSWRN